MYDAGQSVMSLAIEAEHIGLSTHQMLGFTESVVKKEFAIPDNWRVIVLIALGYKAKSNVYENSSRKVNLEKFKTRMFEKIRDRAVKPRERKPLKEIASFNKFTF